MFRVEHSAQCRMPNKKERNMIFLLTSITLDSHVSGDWEQLAYFPVTWL